MMKQMKRGCIRILGITLLLSLIQPAFAQLGNYDLPLPYTDEKEPTPEELDKNFRPEFVTQLKDIGLNEDGEVDLDFRFFFGLGGFRIANSKYFQFVAQPEWYFLKVGIGLDFALNFDMDGIRKEDWNNGYAWFQKIKFISWGEKGNKPFYLRLGTIPNYSLGHGTLVKRYSNLSFAPEIKMRGLIFDIDMHYAGFEFFINDFTELDLVGFRIFQRPLKIPETKVFYVDYVLSEMEVGVSFVGDYNPTSMYTIVYDRDNPTRVDSIAKVDVQRDRNIRHHPTRDGEDKMGGYSIDFGIPFVKFPQAIEAMFYADYVRINRLAGAWHFGILGSIVPNEINLEFRLELYKAINTGYMANFFDTTYDAFKIYRYNQAYQLKAAQRQSDPGSTHWGWLFGLRNTVEVGDKRYLGFSWELNEDEISGIPEYSPGIHMRMGLYLLEALPHLTATLIYDQYGIKLWKDLFHEYMDESFWAIEAEYHVTPDFSVSIAYNKSFRYKVEDDYNTTFEIPEKEPLRSLIIQTRMHF
jgi:hypothetical protein